MKPMELSADSLVVSAWKDYFKEIKNQEDRQAQIRNLKAVAISSTEFAVCNSLSVGDVGQVVDDVDRGRITKERAEFLAEKASQLGLLVPFKLKQLKGFIS